MLAQFLAAAEAARTAAVLDELARKLWRAHSEGHLADADAKAISEAVEARSAAPRENVRARPFARTRPQRQGQDHAPRALPLPQHGEGQGVWPDHSQGDRGARGAVMGLPQRQKRPLLPVL